ncbi:MAG: hypothetical protein WCB99_14440 [Candidatus Cybelea sp.]
MADQDTLDTLAQECEKARDDAPPTMSQAQATIEAAFIISKTLEACAKAHLGPAEVETPPARSSK